MPYTMCIVQCAATVRPASPVRCVVLTKLFRGLILSSHLLESFNMHIQSRVTRVAASTLFSVPRGRVNAAQSSLFSRVPPYSERAHRLACTH